MAKTTATVTVGADTSPFERKMRTLGKGIGGGLTTGIGKVGGMAMSGLGAGVGAALGFLGLQGAGSIFDMMLAESPALNEQFTKLKTTLGDALQPAAEKLAEVLEENMPEIQEALESFGNMLSDALDFWTEDAWDPAVWADIGEAIAEAVKEAFKPENIKQSVADVGTMVEEQTGSSTLRWLAENSTPVQVLNAISYFVSDEEGAKSL